MFFMGRGHHVAVLPAPLVRHEEADWSSLSIREKIKEQKHSQDYRSVSHSLGMKKKALFFRVIFFRFL